jgi:ABC-type multidrug transport system fused ATPase/permease subunit
LFFSIKGLAVYGNNIYRVALQQQLIRKIRLSSLRLLNQSSFMHFVKSDIGRIQNTMTGEVDRVQRAYQTYFFSLQQLILVIIYAGFAFFIDFQFALLVCTGGALTNILYRSIYKKTKGASRKLTGDSHIYQGQVIQFIAHYKYLRATGRAKEFANHLENTIKYIENTRKKIGELAGVLVAAREPMLMGVVAITIIVQVNFLGGSLGPIFISILFFYRALTSLTNMQNTWNQFLEASGSLDNLQSFQQELKAQKETDGSGSFQGLQMGISLKSVSFGYGEKSILEGIDLEILKNQSIAFVGESGSGKTTLINLIAGLLPAQMGEVRIDGLPLSQLQKESYQQRIGYITQDPVIFNDSIFKNVTFWAVPTSENRQRFWEVLQRAAIHDFVMELPDKEHTELGNNGINISGGQKQRISIARELYKDVDILIMDEATSALDSETEKMIQENIDALKGQYTIMIVAHRLSTIKNADRIVLMDKGRIIEQGSFETLVERVPRFRKMVELQEAVKAKL